MNQSETWWLDTHAGTVTALATIVLAGLTAVYVVITKQTLKAQREALRLQHAPRVVAYIGRTHADQRRSQNETALRLVVHNVGGSPANNVKVEADSDSKAFLAGSVAWPENWIWPIKIGRLDPGEIQMFTIVALAAGITPTDWDSAAPRLKSNWVGDDGTRGCHESLVLWMGKDITTVRANQIDQAIALLRAIQMSVYNLRR